MDIPQYAPLIPHEDGAPWTIVRFRLPQHKRVLPAIIPIYHFFFSKDLLGYLFVQADPKELAQFLFDRCVPAVCTISTTTQKYVVIRDSRVLIYQRIIDDPLSAFRIMPHPLDYYGLNREKLVCVHGPLKGLTGYVVRTHRDRKFVFRLENNATCAASNIQKSSFLTLSEYAHLPKDQQVQLL